MNARYYVPEIGRFASADTLVPDPQNPQSFNRYGYALDNPIKYADPSGHCAEFGDDACWSLAEQLWSAYGIDLEFLGSMTLEDLAFFGTTFEQMPGLQQEQVASAIQSGFLDRLDEGTRKSITDGVWDVLGVRIGLSAANIMGVDSSVDFLWNFSAREFDILGNVNGVVGWALGASLTGGVFFGFDAPENNAFTGWGTGVTLGAAVGPLGVAVQTEKSGGLIGFNPPNPITRDAQSLAVLYNPGLELEASFNVGYTWNISSIFRSLANIE